MNNRPWFLIFISMLFYGVGEYMSKVYANQQRWSYFWITVFSFMVPSTLFLPIIVRWNNLAVLGILWNVIYMFITLFIALVCFHEPVTAIQKVGIGLGIISVVLLSWQ